MAIKIFSALFFTILLAISASVSVFAVLKIQMPTENHLNGAFTKSYEDSFDKNLPHRASAISFYNKIHHMVFGEGRKGVLIGADGWLFTDEEFALSDDYQNNITKNKYYILSVQKKLSQDKVKLFILPLPAKARLFPNQLGRYQYPENWQSHYSDFLSFLDKEGIAHNEGLENILSKPEAFLKTDTHWTPEGARITAFNTALHIEKTYPYLSWKNERFISAKENMIAHEGDLTRYTVKDGENINQWVTEAQSDNDDLFGDKNYDVVLVGTSYSANSLWNFDGFLKEALGADVLNMADEGLGPFQVMKNYLESDQYKNDKPQLLIWEMPERYLPVTVKDNS